MNFKRTIEVLLFLVLIGSYIFFFKDDFISAYEKISYKIDPCPTPIAYSIGELDSQFGVSREEFKEAIKEAEDLWEKASGRDLFEYSDSGEMTVNLVYDYRQESTVKMSSLEETVDSDAASYSKLKAEHDSKIAEYNSAVQSLSSAVSEYNSEKAAYEQEVKEWNRKGGSTEKYNQLLEEKSRLDGMLSSIQSRQQEVGVLASEVNQLVEQLNILAENMNLNIEKYNRVSDSLDQEFEEGNYISDIGSKEINIYQFDDEERLVRVLAHEMGHALGIDHLGDSEDIMYAYNIGENSEITEEDLEALNTACPE